MTIFSGDENVLPHEEPVPGVTWWQWLLLISGMLAAMICCVGACFATVFHHQLFGESMPEESSSEESSAVSLPCQ
eukprot:CAMPEP_0172834408 /NCGR_PEP_ID=MMETSP1075-20121228/25030_1 /TAXON_ID=2916 /ORGANISM="Ceratium fusus, Strain PA161109" /LENGTH=74 /DNA_ID=CAMNT_0013677301 /DNA_START=41 /DNA_END=262 /DNA_ORIENTATION=-